MNRDNFVGHEAEQTQLQKINERLAVIEPLIQKARNPMLAHRY